MGSRVKFSYPALTLKIPVFGGEGWKERAFPSL
jgi:hypothetical protein